MIYVYRTIKSRVITNFPKIWCFDPPYFGAFSRAKTPITFFLMATWKMVPRLYQSDFCDPQTQSHKLPGLEVNPFLTSPPNITYNN